MGWGVWMKDCLFLSTEEEKIACFEECPFLKDEEACPFKNLLPIKNINIKDYQLGYLFEEEEEETILPFPEVYKEEYD